ncbi:MAG: hemin uptake protein HemP [Cellvibrionaceae bacterium]
MSDISLAKAPRGSTPKVTATQLFQGGKTLLIQHNGDEYRLQVTRSRKLILTK